MTLKLVVIGMGALLGFLCLWNIVFYLDFLDMQKKIKELMEED